jgi:hypothetical protein
MRIDHHICRWLAIASLIFSVSLSSLMPDVMTQLHAGAQSAVTEPSTGCCCRVSTAEGCGMACCIERDVPAPKPTPTPARSAQRDNTSLGAALAKVVLRDLDANLQARFALAESHAALSADESSLQAKHIRIDA